MSEERYTVNYEYEQWMPLFDEQGNELIGIRGKAGVVAKGSDGVEMGLDVVELQPGAAFPPHTHPGDHILYLLSGKCQVVIGNLVHQMVAGSALYVSASLAHHVANPFYEPCRLLAYGHPHKGISDHDRMQLVGEPTDELPDLRLPLTPHQFAQEYQGDWR